MEIIFPLKCFYLSLHITGFTNQSWTGPVELESMVTLIIIVMNYGQAFSCFLTNEEIMWRRTVRSSFILTAPSFPNIHGHKVKQRPTCFCRADSTVPTLWVSWSCPFHWGICSVPLSHLLSLLWFLQHKAQTYAWSLSLVLSLNASLALIFCLWALWGMETILLTFVLLVIITEPGPG